MKTQNTILKLNFFLVLLTFTLNSCKNDDCEEATPACIKEFIESEEYECLSVANKVSTNLGTLYEFDFAECFIWKIEYYNKNCELVCSVGIGSFNTCQDLDTIYSRELIWERY